MSYPWVNDPAFGKLSEGQVKALALTIASAEEHVSTAIQRVREALPNNTQANVERLIARMVEVKRAKRIVSILRKLQSSLPRDVE